jgi:hypothetical protein
VRLKVREAQNGKFFYDFYNESEWGRKTPPDTRIASVHASAKDGGDSRVALGELGAAHGERPAVRIDDGNLSKKIIAPADAVNLDVREGSPPDPRASSAAESAKGGAGFEGTEPQAHGQRRPPAHAPSPEAPAATIAQAPDAVNLDVRGVTPDWTPEPPERAAPAARVPDERAAVDRALDHEAARILEEGGGTPEDRAALESAAEDMETVNREEEAALTVLSCITGASDV